TPASGREMNSGASRSAGNQAAVNENGNRGGSRTFSPPRNSGTRSESIQPSRSQPERSMGQASSANRPESAAPSRGEPNRGEWRAFTPPSRSSESASRGGSSAGPSARNESGSY